MVNIRLKQALALFVAVSFVSSMFFFFPHFSNVTPITYYIVVPSNLLEPNSSYLGNPLQIQKGVTYDIISFSQAVPVSTLEADNISNMLDFAGSMLSNENISYNVSNGNLQCLFSRQFVSPLCADLSNGSSWGLFSVASNGNLVPEQIAPEYIKIGSIDSNSTFILAFFAPSNASSNGTTIPHINLG